MITPYLTFAGNCREALAFYESAFETTVMFSQPYGDYVPQGVSNPPQDLKDWILHAEMVICETVFWFADEVTESAPKGSMIKLAAKVPTAEDAQVVFDCLSAGAHITLPPTETFYSTFHAGLTDAFGVGWNIVAEEAPSGN